MRNRKLTLLLAMLVLAIFAVGAVSAEDNVTDIDVPTEDTAIDEVAVDDDSAGETDEIEETQQTRTIPYDVDENTTDIQYVINTSENSTHVVNFQPIQYNLTNALKIHGNVTLYGNGATLLGIGNNNIFDIADASNFTITGFNIITNSTSKTAFYGANVFNANISYNNITGGKDGINIMQKHDNLTIVGNNITGVVRDAISIIDHRTLSDLSGKGNSIISGNIITGPSQYGMFFGGNFKGTISNNIISGTDVGVEFAGKKAATNGKLCVQFDNNTITNVYTGINMLHPNILCFNITNSNISASFDAIATDTPFGTSITYIGVYNSTFVGDVSDDFKRAAGNHTANNYGF